MSAREKVVSASPTLTFQMMVDGSVASITIMQKGTGTASPEELLAVDSPEFDGRETNPGD